MLLAGCAPRSADMRLPTPQAAEPVNPGKTFQWMGSGEAAALSRQGWQALARAVVAAAKARPAAGLGEAKAGDTLLLQGDVAPGSGKDPRRAATAAKYCVLAMGGDQLGDFSDLFNARGLPIPARRALAQAPAILDLWGKGWFLMPNPLYGPGVTGSFDDIFPAGKRWPGPQTETK